MIWLSVELCWSAQNLGFNPQYFSVYPAIPLTVMEITEEKQFATFDKDL